MSEDAERVNKMHLIRLEGLDSLAVNLDQLVTDLGVAGLGHGSLRTNFLSLLAMTSIGKFCGCTYIWRKSSYLVLIVRLRLVLCKLEA